VEEPAAREAVVAVLEIERAVASNRPAGWLPSVVYASAGVPRRGEVLLARTQMLEEAQLLPVNDHLAPAQFDELVLGQEAEESLLMPDE
jgi:hypothetical protein